MTNSYTKKKRVLTVPPKMETKWGGKKVALQWLDVADLTPDLPVSSVHSVPVVVNDDVVLVKHPRRGWELPGGHVEEGETPEEALIRELAEEAAVSGTSTLLGAIRVDNSVDSRFVPDKYPPVAHQLFYRTDVQKIDRFSPDFETMGRKFVALKGIQSYLPRWSPFVKHAFSFAQRKREK